MTGVSVQNHKSYQTNFIRNENHPYFHSNPAIWSDTGCAKCLAFGIVVILVHPTSLHNDRAWIRVDNPHLQTSNCLRPPITLSLSKNNIPARGLVRQVFDFFFYKKNTAIKTAASWREDSKRNGNSTYPRYLGRVQTRLKSSGAFKQAQSVVNCGSKSRIALKGVPPKISVGSVPVSS